MANIDISLPSVRPGATAEEQLKDLRAYCQKLGNQLNQVLNNLDLESFGEETATIIRNAASLAEKTDNATKEIGEARSEFFKRATQINSRVDTVTEQMQALTEAQAGNEQWRNEVEAVFSRNAYGAAYAVEIKDYINRIFGGEDSEKTMEIEGTPYTYEGVVKYGYFDTGNTEEIGLLLAGSKSGGAVMRCILSTNQIRFFHGNDEKAHFGVTRMSGGGESEVKGDMYIDDVRAHSVSFRGLRNTTQFSFVAKKGTGDNAGKDVLQLQYGQITDEEMLSNLSEAENE